MTVRELKKIVGGLPDELLVVVCDAERKPVNSVAVNYELPASKHSGTITFFSDVTPTPKINSAYELMREECE